MTSCFDMGWGLYVDVECIDPDRCEYEQDCLYDPRPLDDTCPTEESS